MNYLNNLEEVDNILLNLPSDFHEIRKIFTNNELLKLWSTEGVNEFSNEYISIQNSAYQKIAGKPYSLKSETITQEKNDNDFWRPFPYTGGSAMAISDFLLTVGRLFRLVDFKNGEVAIEFGAGHGHLTMQLIMTGLKVTAVDLNEFELNSLKARAKSINSDIDILLSNFTDVNFPNNSFKYVIFKSSFHHCMQHRDLLTQLYNMLEDNGKLIFCDEPVFENWDQPWGIRCDLESIWAIRSFGWLELGFSYDYFINLLLLKGFYCRKYNFTESKSESIFIAEKIKDYIPLSEMSFSTTIENSLWPEFSFSDKKYRFMKTEHIEIIIPEIWQDKKQIKLKGHNFLSEAISVSIHSGTKSYKYNIQPFTEFIFKIDDFTSKLNITSDLLIPEKLNKKSKYYSKDSRKLGFSIESMSI